MAYIYKVTNQINGKVYIGKTTKDIQQRWKQHQQDSKRDYCKNRPFYRALNKYGIESFIIEEIEQCDISILEEREIYWINYYRSYVGWEDCNGYNATLGGDGKTYCDYNLVYNLWQEGKNNKEIQEITHYDHGTIAKILYEKGISTEKRIERGRITNRKPVLMYDLISGIGLKSFHSACEGATYIKENKNIFASTHSISTNIARACGHKQKSAYGYGWKFI